MSSYTPPSLTRYDRRSLAQLPPPGHAARSGTFVASSQSHPPPPPVPRVQARNTHYNTVPWNTSGAMPRSNPFSYANQSPIPYPSPPLTGTPSYPPPIQVGIRRCRELPDVTGVAEPIRLNPTLEYSNFLRPADGWSTVSSSFTDEDEHICPPATDPGLASMTLILPSGQPVVVHRISDDFVTVGDVVTIIDQSLQTLSPSGSRPVLPPVQRRENGEELCPCELGSTSMIYLRSRYEKAGLRARENMPGTWNLLIRH